MPNFTLDIVNGDQVPWVDEATNDFPSRQNNDPQFLASYRRFDIAGGPQTVEVHATVNGVDAPLDVDLGGMLFVAAWKEWSGYSPPPIVQPPGQTSVMTFEVTNQHVGHFCLVVRRPSGGAVFIHFDVEEVV